MPTYTPTYTSPATAYTATRTSPGTAYASTYEPSADRYLLKEDGFYLLLENGGKILIERTVQYTPTYTAN
jgi:hypothetical protein